MKKKVFINYAREDVETARKLFHDLEHHGYDPWLDEKNLLPGQNWRMEIPKVIRETGYMLVILSDKSTTKRGFVQAEQALALEVLDEFPRDEIFLIPVRLVDCELPFRLESLTWVDLFPKYESGFKRIIKALESERASDVPKPPTGESPPPEAPLIYVSFSLIDNVNGWVNTLVGLLTTEVAQRIGSENKFKIFMDIKADSECTPPPKNVLDLLENAAVFIPVVSPGYLASDRCTRERHTFFREAETRDNAHALIVERLNIDQNSRPDEFKTVRPKRFWVRESSDKPPRILGHPTLNLDRDKVYYERILDISDKIKKILLHAGSEPEKVKATDPKLEEVKPAPEKTEDVEAAPNDRLAIYLAEVPEDLLDARDEMERYLDQSEFRVLPEQEIPLTNSKHFKESVKKELRDCRVFVQLLSGFPGKTRSLLEGICRPQYECAQETGKNIIQWRDPKLKVDEVADQDQKKLLVGQKVMAGGMTEFKEQVVKRARSKTEDLAVPGITPDVLVFLNADKSDESHAMDVAGVMDQHRVSCALPVWEGKAADILADMEDFILNSHGVIVFYGKADALWVRKQLRYCRNLNFRREEPLKALAVFEGPPQEKPGFNFMIPGLEIIDCRDCLDEKKFKPFLAALGKGGQS